ncbi:MAG: Rpn family recombination-promoting nuclease/putative transposase [Firmicutes bacterium]|nr:Rpn family recombination-promoting nuclease/putative transposase [Bacillota bacterium]
MTKQIAETDLFANTHRSELPLTSDYVFRTVFGRDRDDSRAALMEILNIILDRKEDPIQAIEIKNPIDTAESSEGKETIMDIRAETSRGELLDIEVQTGHLAIYPNRVVFYGGRLVNSSLQQGESNDKMKKSIVVSIVNGVLFPSLPFCHNVFEVRERETGLLLSDRLSFHFLELDKADRKKPISELTRIEKLAIYLKYANDETMKDCVQEILAGEEFAMSEKAYRSLTKDEVEYQRMESKIRAELHWNTEVEYARREGHEDGYGEGRTEGIDIGEDKLGKLNMLLIEQNRFEDLKKVSTDKAYRHQLYREFGLEEDASASEVK